MFFASNELRTRRESPVVLRVMTVMGDIGLYAPSMDRWPSLEIGRNKGVEVMTLVGRASGICLQPWLPGRSSYVRIGVTQGLPVCAIVWYLFCASWFQLVHVSTLAAMMDVTAAAGSEIPMTTLSHLGAVDLSSLGDYW